MKPKDYKPNSVLPDGGMFLERSIKREIGDWAEMVFGAKVERLGIVWYRVKGGMSGRGDREDWVANVDGVSISVHDYHWNGEEFGANHGSFNGAVKAETKSALESTKWAIKELEKKLESKRNSLKIMLAATGG